MAGTTEGRGLAMALTVELLYFSSCPNYLAALKSLQAEMTAHGIEIPVQMVAVESQAEAERLRFYGSPTIRINGHDVVPPPSRARPTLACRLYRAADGANTAIPPQVAIRAVLRGTQVPSQE